VGTRAGGGLNRRLWRPDPERAEDAAEQAAGAASPSV
jgi:hypothetical protein